MRVLEAVGGNGKAIVDAVKERTVSGTPFADDIIYNMVSDVVGSSSDLDGTIRFMDSDEFEKRVDEYLYRRDFKDFMASQVPQIARDKGVEQDELPRSVIMSEFHDFESNDVDDKAIGSTYKDKDGTEYSFTSWDKWFPDEQWFVRLG